MMRRRLTALLLLAVAACGSPDEGHEEAEATALHDAARVPLDRAEQVQQTLDDRAARIATEAEEAEKKEKEKQP